MPITPTIQRVFRKANMRYQSKAFFPKYVSSQNISIKNRFTTKIEKQNVGYYHCISKAFICRLLMYEHISNTEFKYYVTNFRQNFGDCETRFNFKKLQPKHHI